MITYLELYKTVKFFGTVTIKNVRPDENWTRFFGDEVEEIDFEDAEDRV